jgi:site-specific DNA-cytosine methylase
VELGYQVQWRALSALDFGLPQGFPNSFKIVCGDSQTRKQAGDAGPGQVLQAVLRRALAAWRGVATG